MPSPNILRIVPHGLAWQVVTDNTRRPIDILCSRERAIDHAREIATSARIPALVYLENRDGSIELIDITNAANDPIRPM